MKKDIRHKSSGNAYGIPKTINKKQNNTFKENNNNLNPLYYTQKKLNYFY